MMRIIGLCVGAVMVMLLVAVGFANAAIDEAGTTAANFLTLGSGARVLGMGGAALGLGDDLGGGAWNPAALGYMNRTEVVFSHSALGDGSLQEWAAIGGRLGGGATRWSVSGLYHGEGTFEGRDASNLPTGSFSASSFAFGVHLARRFGDAVSLGAGSKIVSENLGDVSGFGATFDFGATAHHGPFGFGLAAQNLGGQMKYDGLPYRFPSNLGAGLSYAVPLTGIRLALDANFPSTYYNDVRFGAEYLWHDVVAIRAGYRHEMSDVNDPLTGPTFGLGAGWNGMWMDYGYLVSSTGEAQHRLGFRLFPGHGGSGGGSYGQTDQPSIAPPAPKRHALKETPPATKPVAAPAIGTPVKSAPAEAKPTAPAKSAATVVPDSRPTASVAKPDAPAKSAAVESKAVTSTARPAAPGTKAVTPETKAVTPAPKAVTPEPKAVAPAPKAVTPTPKPAAPAAKPAEAAPKPVAPAPKPADAAPKPAEPAPTPPAAAPSQDKPAAGAAASSTAPASTPATDAPRPTRIKVQAKDTLAAIGRRWNVSVAALMMENNMVSEHIQSGQTLKLPAAGR